MISPQGTLENLTQAMYRYASQGETGGCVDVSDGRIRVGRNGNLVGKYILLTFYKIACFYINHQVHTE